MIARVVRAFVDKYSMQLISKDTHIEISQERFSELTTGPRGIFVEEIIKEKKQARKKGAKE